MILTLLPSRNPSSGQNLPDDDPEARSKHVVSTLELSNRAHPGFMFPRRVTSGKTLLPRARFPSVPDPPHTHKRIHFRKTLPSVDGIRVVRKLIKYMAQEQYDFVTVHKQIFVKFEIHHFNVTAKVQFNLHVSCKQLKKYRRYLNRRWQQ